MTTKNTPSRLLGLFTALLFSSVLHAETIKLANGEWAPYLSEELKAYGYVSDIVKQAFAEEGIEVAYTFLPWKRGFEDAKTGKLDGSIVWSKTEERAADFHYSEPVLDLQTVFFMKKDGSFDWTDKASLEDKKLGGVIGYSYGLEDEEKAGKIKITRIGNAQGNYKKLMAGRIDATPEDEAVGYNMVHELGLADQVEAHPKPLKSRSYHLIVSKASANAERYVAAFNKGLKKLQDSGKFQAIVEAARRGEYK